MKGFLAICVMCLCLMTLIGRMGYTDELYSELEYCENVHAKRWPDYRRIYTRMCSPERLKEIKNILR